MNILSMLMWVTQFGLSGLFPLCFFLILGIWLQGKYGLGLWVIIAAGMIGFLTGIRTARACLKAMRKESERPGRNGALPAVFNDHT